MTVCLFIMLLGSCVVLSLKRRLDNFIGLVFTVHLAFLLLTAGFIQSLPRHTTLALPVFVSTMIVLFRDRSVQPPCPPS